MKFDKASAKQNVTTYFKDNMGILIAFAVLYLFLAINPATHEAFLTRQNMFNVIRQLATNLYLACGMTMVIILGGIDLSVGSIIALSGCVAAGVARGFAYVYTGGSPVRVVTKAWQFIGAGYIGIFPTPVILLVIILIVTGLLMNNTRFGRHIYAVGGNVQAAHFSGISVEKVKFKVYMYSGIMAGIAGIVLASRMYSGQPTAGEGASSRHCD